MATAAPSELPVGGMAPRPFRVVSRQAETHDTWTLELEPVSGEPIAVAPGQFTMLYAFGIGEVPISVSGAPGWPLVQTVRAVGAVSEAICAAEPGAVLGVRGPYGNAWPIDTAVGSDIVIVAGGIGLAPLRGAVYEALRRRREFGEVVLLYGSRTPDDLLFTNELEAWAAELQLDVTVDTADRDWRGKVGVVPKLIPTASFDPAAATALVVGPEIMMRFAVQALLETGIPGERIHLSMERNMRCGLGWCGHCQLGPTLICRDGPVYSWAELEPLLAVREL
jgi:anaerobic sulfite reductase subunit B